MRTLLVGDLHLKAQLILPLVEQKVDALHCNQVILMGDYMDEYNQNFNVQLYHRELEVLLSWKAAMVSKGVEVITLVGNHDAPYLIGEMRGYSLHDGEGFNYTGEKLFELGLQVAYQLDDYVVSHAGFSVGQDVLPWYSNRLTSSDVKLIRDLEEHVGQSRGGRYWVGSPIWADYQMDLKDYPSLELPKQIVGHTPQKRIFLDSTLIAIDTFTMIPIKREPYFELLGNGDLLLYDDGRFSVVETEWQSADTIRKLQDIME